MPTRPSRRPTRSPRKEEAAISEGVSKRTFLKVGAGLSVAAAALAVLSKVDCADKPSTDTDSKVEKKCNTNITFDFPNDIPNAPEYKFTGKPIEFKQPADLNLPEGVDFKITAGRIHKFLEEEVRKFREHSRSERECINFIIALNKKLNSIFDPDTNASLGNEFDQYFVKNNRKFVENWIDRLNQYLLPLGFYFSTFLREGKLQISPLDKKKTQIVEAKMGGKEYKIPVLSVVVSEEYKKDLEVAGYTKTAGTIPVVIVRSNVIKSEREKFKSQFEAKVQELDSEKIDTARFYKLWPLITRESGAKSVAQHEAAHYISYKEFSNQQVGERPKEYTVNWKGTRNHQLRFRIPRNVAEEVFAPGVQIATHDHPWMHHMRLMLNELYAKGPGLLFTLATVASIPDCKTKAEIIQSIEEQGIHSAVKDIGLVNRIFECMLSKDYTDEHSKKAGELYMQLGYDYFLQNS